jgi:HupE / UreJ protein
VIRAILWNVLVVACLMLSTTVRAHKIVEQVVEMVVQPRGDRLLVRLHVPATALVNAKLPQLDDGKLNTAALEGPLRVVAGDIARNLDIWQADAALAPPTAVAKAGADGSSVDVDLTYVIQAGTSEISARLNTFQALDQPVRTNVHFQGSPELEHLVSVTGAPVRVLFDPSGLEAFQQFLARGLRAVLDGGDHLLFLVCMLIPMRRGRVAVSLLAVMIAGQAVTILISALWPTTIAALLPALAMVGASTVVIAAFQNIVRARLRWVWPLAIIFGALSGFTFGNTIAVAQQFGGSHPEIALVTFLVVVMAGQFWVGAVMWGTRAWVHGLRLSERIATMVASGLIAHSALDRVVDRGHEVAQAGSFTAERVLVWLTLGWTCVILLALMVEALRHRWMTDDGDHLTNVVQAS